MVSQERKEAGINKIEQVNIVPVIKPNARQTINEKANEQNKKFNKTVLQHKKKKLLMHKLIIMLQLH